MKKILIKKWYYVVLIVLLLFFIGCTVSKMVSNKEMLDLELPVKEKPKLVPPKFESGPATHIIEINAAGFSQDELIINLGDKVIWKNVREGKLKSAIVQGTKTCVYMKSPLLQPNQEFELVFENEGKCQVMEAVTKIQFMDVIVK